MKRNKTQEQIDRLPRPDAIVPRADSPIIEADAAMAGYEFVRDLTLAEGQGVTGATYLGKGEPAAIADPATGDVREVPTVLLKVRNVTYRMLASAMLERLLGAVKPGAVVAICNRGMVETRRGRRMTAWDVGIRK